jgi:enoyl-CoA hydratase/carnithine racemase
MGQLSLSSASAAPWGMLAPMTETMTEPLRLERAGATAVLTLARPERRNSLSDATLAALRRALDEIASDEGVRALVIAADGPVFSSGHDLRELQARRNEPGGGASAWRSTFDACAAVMTAIVQLPQPVIAAVEGVATAAGCQLVASCDLAVAGAAARFATPGVNIGLFCSTPGVALVRAIAPKHAMEMLLTGEMIDADTALRFGLVNRVTGEGTALAEARRWADQIADKPPEVIRGGKAVFRRQAPQPLADAYALASGAMAESVARAEAAEGLGAFLSKRPPVWP